MINQLKPPSKPKIPFILKFGLLFWGITAFSYNYLYDHISESSINFDNLISEIIKCGSLNLPNINISTITTILLITSILLIAYIFIRKKHTTFNFMVLAIICGLIVSIIAADNLQKNQNDIYKLNNKIKTIKIIEDEQTKDNKNTSIATIKGENKNYKIRIDLPESIKDSLNGDLIRCKVSLNSPYESQKLYFWQNNISANGVIDNYEFVNPDTFIAKIYNVRRLILNNLRDYDKKLNNSDKHSSPEQLLAAIIIGYKPDLNSSDLYDNFKTSGLAHIVAVSGAHLTLVTALLTAILKLLKLKKKFIIVFQSFFLLAYLVCSGIPISALRAAFMAYIAIFSFISKRRTTSLNSIGLCIIIFISLNPQTSLSVAFALSIASTIGIVLFSNLITYWIKKLCKVSSDKIITPLSLTLSANICSIPLSISVFNQFSIISPLSNIIIAPLFTLICGFGMISNIFSISLSKFFPIINDILMWSCFKIAKFMTIIVSWLGGIPYACISSTMNIFIAILLTLILCTIIYYFWPVKKEQSSILFGKFYNVSLNEKPNTITQIYMPKNKVKKFFKFPLMIFLLLAIIISTSTSSINHTSDTTLKVLDVGQGDSILLESKNKKFLIDTGNQDNLLKTQLAENQISHLDGLMITHPDDDHCGSMDVIKNLVVVDNVYIANDLTTTQDNNCKKLTQNIKELVDNKNIIRLNVDDEITFGEYKLEVVWPDKYSDNGGNGDSLCVVANIDLGNDGTIENRCLLCGDAEYEQIEQMQKLNRIDNIDIYKCGHHGSKNALSDTSAKKLSPKISIISVGEHNRYNHPSKTTLDKLEKIGSKIYRTDKSGTITCLFKHNGLKIITQR